MNIDQRLAGAAHRGGMARTAWCVLALAALAALAVFAYSHPLGMGWGALIVIGVLAVMSVRRDAWLVAVPGLMPVLDLAAWTGAIHFTESDALVLGALAVGGLREALWPRASRRGRYGAHGAHGGYGGHGGRSGSGGHGGHGGHGGEWRFGVVQCALLGLMALSYGLSTAWQPLLAVATDPALLAGYSTSLNGVRLTKGLVWALLLLPLLGCALRARPRQARRALVAGLILGLVLVSLAVLWERAAFTGLSDFASDYRTTALFWEMNVGGATLDGWLALTLPFALWLALQARSRTQLLFVLALLALAGYVSFTTFSRGLYLGAGLGGALTVVLMVRQVARQVAQRGSARVSMVAVLVWGVFALGLGALLAGVFQSGGYRGLGAMLGVALAVYALAPVVACMSGRALGAAVMLALVAVVISVAAMWWVPKGVYLAYALSAACLLALLLSEPAGRWLALAGTLATACLLWLAANAALVTMFWSEAQVLWPGVLAAAALLLPLAVVRVRPDACWRPSAQGWVMVALALGALTLVVVSLNTYYASKRMETVAEDLGGRVLHWSLAASLPESAHERWLGVGVGQFAARYFWRVPDGMYPGSHRIEDAAGNRYLRLGGPRHVLSFGELYRVSQQISPRLQPPLLLALSARAPEGDGRLHVEVCHKHLLYADQCTGRDLLVAGGADWQRLDLALDGKGLGSGGAWLPRLTVFSVANAGRGRVVEVDDISLVDGAGRSLLDNGEFAAASDFWFFSSDRHHLPWHAKNLWLHYFVEQGWVGAAAFSLLCLGAFYRVTVGRGASHALAPSLAGALLGFFVVGAFDSLLDAPRLTTLALMIMLLALGLRPASSPNLGRVPSAQGGSARVAGD